MYHRGKREVSLIDAANSDQCTQLFNRQGRKVLLKDEATKVQYEPTLSPTKREETLCAISPTKREEIP